MVIRIKYGDWPGAAGVPPPRLPGPAPEHGLRREGGLRGNHLSNTTRPAHVLFKRGK